MDKVLGDLRYKAAIAYQDDVIVYSENFDPHLQHLQLELERFQEAKLSVNIKKCQFAMKEIKFLGFIVTDKGILADPDKFRPTTVLPAPTNLKELERFLGMTGTRISTRSSIRACRIFHFEVVYVFAAEYLNVRTDELVVVGL
jgi:hypothetical protein